MIAGSPGLARADLLGVEVLDVPLADVTAAIVARPAGTPFGYVVTPNADHLARLDAGDTTLARCYAAAEARVFDSRFLARVGRLLGTPMPRVVTGSDLTDAVLRAVPRDTPVTVIGTTAPAVTALRERFGLSEVDHLDLPFGFDPEAADIVDQALAHLRDRPATLVLLACGSPRQEILAHAIAAAGGTTGIGLCIGSAVDQVGGHVRRAPHWLRATGFEWVWRILTEPRRLIPRYLKAFRAVVALHAARRPIVRQPTPTTPSS
ncbi:WecB/TagA/CpsF family glycosyltransferase [Sphingomonas floccifaciens]|uniref:WecB/TagA/CpsF family glycosyltransferase n=1 Tax=Sphingomonas floccifaciens TaxID=1844115 RepID=A0ABW4NI42_9SPHN